MPPTVLRIQCKRHVEHKCLFRLYPDSVQHAITAHTVDTRNNEPLTVPNSMPLCFGLLPWDGLSVQLPPPQINVCFIPTHFLRLSAGISSRKPFLTPPIPTSLCWVLFWVFLGDTWPSICNMTVSSFSHPAKPQTRAILIYLLICNSTKHILWHKSYSSVL